MPENLNEKEEFDNLLFAKALQRAIRDKGISYEALAGIIDKQKNTVTQMCMGIRLTSIPTLIDICNALDITPDYLLSPYLLKKDNITEDEYHKLLRSLNKLKQNELNMLYAIINAIINNRK